MYVPVHEKLRLVALYDVVKALKTSVRKGIEVVQMPRGSMGDEDIDPALQKYLKPHSAAALAHLLFGVHILALAVFMRSAEAHDAHTVVGVDFVLDANTAARRAVVEIVVVVALDVEDSRARCVHQKLKIVAAEVAAGQNKVVALELAGNIVII